MNVAIIGANGSIGSALIKHISQDESCKNIYAFARSEPEIKVANVRYNLIDYTEESKISFAADVTDSTGPLDLVIVTIGMLHSESIKPEKSLQSLATANIEQVLHTNAIIPSIVAKFFLPKLAKHSRSIFVALSARVGSISDNKLGGWYSYRMSKAALNMFIKTVAIEYKRTHTHSIIVGIHPGTVDSELSKPYQNNVQQNQVFSPEYSARKIVEVIGKLDPEDTGKILAWDGVVITP